MDSEVQEEIKRFNGLIDEEAARLLVMARKGELPQITISNLKESTLSLTARVMHVGTREKDVVKMVVGDETGYALLKLWDHNVGVARHVREGDSIHVANAWVKKRSYGMEINVGKYGMIERVERDIPAPITFGKREGLFNLKGTLVKKFPTTMYVDDVEHFMCRIVVDGDDIFLLDERARDIQRFCEGDTIVLLWLYRRNGGIYADEWSKIANGDAFP